MIPPRPRRTAAHPRASLSEQPGRIKAAGVDGTVIYYERWWNNRAFPVRLDHNGVTSLYNASEVEVLVCGRADIITPPAPPSLALARRPLRPPATPTATAAPRVPATPGAAEGRPDP